MIHVSLDTSRAKGWWAGPWNSALAVPVGYANEGVDEVHVHEQMFEVYLVACGESVAVVAGREIGLCAGDMLVVEPGEVHTFVQSSDDYLHFVFQAPFVPGDKVVAQG